MDDYAFLTRRLRFLSGHRLPVIIQSEQAECGLACLAMIASWHGYDIDLWTLRQRADMSLRGSTLNGLMGLAASLQLSSRPLRLDLEQLPDLRLPCILHWEMNHFVVLKRVLSRGRGIVIHDPARGEVRVSMAEVERAFTGIALELTPGAQFKRERVRPRVRLSSLLGNVVGLRRSLLQILGLALVLEILSLIGPFFMQWVVDGAILSGDTNLLTLLVLGFGLLMLLQVSIGLARSWIVMYLSTHLSLQWANNIFAHLLRLPMPYFEKRSLGDVVSRFGSVGAIQRALTTNVVEAVIDGLMAVTTLAMMIVYSGVLTGIVIASLAIYVVLRIVAYAPFRRANEQQIVLQAREQTLFLESIRCIQSLKLFNNEDGRRVRWLNALIDSTNRGIATQRMTLGFSTAHNLIAGLENLIIVWIGAKLVLANIFTVGMLLAFLSYKSTFATRIYSLIDKGIDLRMLSLQSERIADIVLTPREDERNSDTQAVPENEPQRAPQIWTGNGVRDLRGECVEFNDVWFRHSENDNWILRGINLRVDAGEFLAIVGPSGCGKTTMIRLLAGLLKPTRGVVRIDGIPYEQLPVSAYRSVMATVMQDDHLFTGSIAENIAFFEDQIDIDWVRQCAIQAGVAREIEAMPMGYDSLIGDMGVGVSGGQKQRILLARALYKRPKLLLLDEATSHLDPQTERTINESISQLQITRIVVAHRAETVRAARRVFDLGPLTSVGKSSVAEPMAISTAG